jgi:hypothetical protein
MGNMEGSSRFWLDAGNISTFGSTNFRYLEKLREGFILIRAMPGSKANRLATRLCSRVTRYDPVKPYPPRI